MSRVVAQFDPTAGSGSFEAGAVNRCSALLVMNESSNFLQLDFGGAGSRMIVQPWFNLVIRLPNPVQTVNWIVVASLQSGGAPVSAVYVIGFDPSEPVSDTLTGPLFRQSNVGNAVTTGAVTTVQNDGNPAGTVVVEATPSGAAGSQAKLTNDGDFLCGGGLLHINNAGVVTAIPAGAIPASALASGYPAASLGAGTLPAGVAVPEANVGSGYPAASLGAGTLPAGVTVTPGQISAGALPSGVTIPANQISPAALSVNSATINGGLTMPAANAGMEVGDTTTANTPHVDFHSVAYANDYDSRVIASGGVNAANGKGNLDIYAALLHTHSPLTVDGALSSDAGALTTDGAGNLTIANALHGRGAAAWLEQFYATTNAQQHWTPQTGAAANWHEFVTWDGSVAAIPFGVGSAAAGAAKAYVSDAGTVVPNGGGSLNGINRISGSGSATVNHGLNATPDAAVVNTNNGSNSTTFGSGSYTATTVYIYQFTAMAWTGLVYRA